jgi:hypothetical protein
MAEASMGTCLTVRTLSRALYLAFSTVFTRERLTFDCLGHGGGSSCPRRSRRTLVGSDLGRPLDIRVYGDYHMAVTAVCRAWRQRGLGDDEDMIECQE